MYVIVQKKKKFLVDLHVLGSPELFKTIFGKCLYVRMYVAPPLNVVSTLTQILKKNFKPNFIYSTFITNLRVVATFCCK